MSDFTARIQAILDTRTAQSQLNAFQTANNQLNIQVNLTGANANLNNILKGLQSQAQNAGTNAGTKFATAFNSGINQINVKNSMSAITNMQNTLKSLKFDSSSINTITQKLNDMNLTVTDVKTKMKGNMLDIQVKGVDELGRAVTVMQQFDSQTGTISTVSKSISQSFNEVSNAATRMATSLQINTLDNKMETWLNKNTRAVKLYGASIESLRTELSSLGANATVGDLKRIENDFKSIDIAAKKLGVTGHTLGTTFKNAFTSITKYVGVSTVIYKSIDAVKQMFDNVVEIDTAMTELKKVTDETAESYARFLDGAGSTAKEIGSTVTAIVNSTADFSRLGYNFQDAQELAKVANIYSVVGDEVDSIDTASSSVISTMAAFSVEAEDAMSIVDKFNEVGNNFAISSGGIGDALTRSASSMAAANNTLDETIALITAANTVVQDPDSVGKRLCRH